MIHFTITSGTGVPSYRQILDQVSYYVASGTLRPGDPLPSIRELAGKLAVNPSTVVKAYGELEHAGVIELLHGKGAFIARGGKRLSASEARKALRERARQLAVEAKQMGVERSVVAALLEDEMEKLSDAEAKDEEGGAWSSPSKRVRS